jgi:hypothetical protein
MSQQSQNRSAVRAPRWPRGLVPWRMTVEKFLERLAKASGLQIEISGARRSQGGEDGMTFEVPGGGGSEPEYAWTPTAASATSINLSAGSISDGVTTRTPTVTGISVHETDLRYIYLVCTLDVTRVDGFVTGGTVTAVSIAAYSALQTNSDTTGYILLCTWQAGAVVNRFRFWSIECQINDNGGGGTAFNTWTAG